MSEHNNSDPLGINKHGNWLDSLKTKWEGNGLEDRTWELTIFCCFPFEESIGHLIPWTEWVKVVKNLFAIPKLIKAGIKNIRKIEKKPALELIRDGILEIEDIRWAYLEAEDIYSLMQDKSISPEYAGQAVWAADAIKVKASVRERESLFPVTELERYKSAKKRNKTRCEFRGSLDHFREILESIERERSIRERSCIRRTEDIFEEKLKQEPRDSTGQNSPELEGSFRTGGAPESFFRLDSSMSGAQGLAARGLEGLIVNLLGRSEQTSEAVEGQFRKLGGRSVEEMGFQPSGLAHLRELTVQAAAALRAMHPSGSASVSLALLALGDLLGGRGSRGAGAGERTAGNPAEPSGGPRSEPVQRREVRIYVEGKRMSGPLELELALSRAGMSPSLRRAYGNLMQYGGSSG